MQRIEGEGEGCEREGRGKGNSGGVGRGREVGGLSDDEISLSPQHVIVCTYITQFDRKAVIYLS